jgi:DeoR/GlpR family transcriptional regulator of sugar metabolism
MSEGSKLSERRKCIMELLARDGHVRVSDLSNALGVSEVTIRNDLEALSNEGVLERVPGGAVQTANSSSEPIRHYWRLAAEKRAIADLMASIIFPEETLMINSGSTTFFAASALAKIPGLKIVTNSIAIATEIGKQPNLRVTLLGGEVNSQFSFTYGDDALAQLHKYRAHRAILSIDGVDPVAGLTSYHSEEIELNRLMIERSGATIIVADSTKIGRESFSRLCSFTPGMKIITNKNADAAVVAQLRRAGVDVMLAG